MGVVVGDIYKTHRFGDVKVLDYKGHKEVTIQFLNTGNVICVTSRHLYRGKIQDNFAKTCYGVGYIGNTKTSVGANHKPSYVLWKDLLKRCYSSEYQATHLSYRGCTATENFHCYANFEKWCNAQIGFNVEGFRLDKDILVKWNKVYSEDTCCFVPYSVNSLLVSQRGRRGDSVIGVTKIEKTGRFVAKVNINGISTNLGSFLSEQEAFYAYKQAKEAHIKEVANKWKDQIDPRVYEALMNWEIHIDD